jgi:hypothetical protein
MRKLEALVLGESGETTRAAYRSGALVVVALRLGADRWEPLYAMCGVHRVSLPRSFCLSLEAVAALETAVIAGPVGEGTT